MEKLDRSKILYILIVLVFLSVFWGWYQFRNASGTDLVVKDAASSSDSSAESADSNLNGKIMVHITGAVKKPGVVTLNQGSRLVEAIDQAGGFTENADPNALNLAKKIQDEEKIYVPVIGETTASEKSSKSNLISINTATLEELKSLPGVGDVIAQGIIDYREKNGGFKQLEELKNVNRIGDKIYEGLAGSITL